MEKQIDLKYLIGLKPQGLNSSDLPKSKIKLLSISNKKNVNTLTSKSPDKMYIQRKSMQTAYQALFRALWQLPDKNVQERVLNAINNDGKTYATTATQTNLSMLKELEPITTGMAIPTTLSPLLSAPDDTTNATTLNKIVQKHKNAHQLLTKRQRKRKWHTLMPEVSKESHTIEILRNNIHKTTNNSTSTKNVPKQSLMKSNKEQIVNNERQNASKRVRLDSISYFLSENFSDLNHDDYLNIGLFEDDKKDQLLKDMIKEHIVAPVLMDNGLLPIHETILENDLKRLKRQIYIWQEIRQIDLNDLLTSEEEDCLQLALINNCDPDIIEVLLLKGLNANSLDTHNNTTLHLAIIHNNKIISLRHLLQRIDLQQLLKLNDSGYTPLHLAIKYERYLLAEYLLNTLDKVHMGKIHYVRSMNFDNNNMDMDIEIHDEIEFTKYYKEICENFGITAYLNGIRGERQKRNEIGSKLNFVKGSNLKQKLLNSRDMCTGNTALLLAMQTKLESCIYLLLAHWSDPCIENFSGQNAQSYFNEYGRSVGLNLDIDNTIENVIKLIEIIN